LLRSSIFQFLFNFSIYFQFSSIFYEKNMNRTNFFWIFYKKHELHKFFRFLRKHESHKFFLDFYENMNHTNFFWIFMKTWITQIFLDFHKNMNHTNFFWIFNFSIYFQFFNSSVWLNVFFFNWGNFLKNMQKLCKYIPKF